MLSKKLNKLLFIRSNRCILGKKITKAVFQQKPRIFFLFCDLDFNIFLKLLAVFTNILPIKLENHGWYS